MWSERKHGLSTEQVPVSAYVGNSKNLKDLKDGRPVLIVMHIEHACISFFFFITLETHRGTSLTRKRTTLRLYRRPMPRVPGES